jgi:hypothetical protein
MAGTEITATTFNGALKEYYADDKLEEMIQDRIGRSVPYGDGTQRRPWWL